MKERLQITYNELSGLLELRRLIVDPSDMLYPVKQRWLEHVSDCRDSCHDYAKIHFPNLYHPASI